MKKLALITLMSILCLSGCNTSSNTEERQKETVNEGLSIESYSLEKTIKALDEVDNYESKISLSYETNYESVDTKEVSNLKTKVESKTIIDLKDEEFLSVGSEVNNQDGEKDTVDFKEYINFSNRDEEYYESVWEDEELEGDAKHIVPQHSLSELLETLDEEDLDVKMKKDKYLLSFDVPAKYYDAIFGYDLLNLSLNMENAQAEVRKLKIPVTLTIDVKTNLPISIEADVQEYVQICYDTTADTEEYEPTVKYADVIINFSKYDKAKVEDIKSPIKDSKKDE